MLVGFTSGIFHMSNRSPRAIAELVIVEWGVQRVQRNIGEKEFEMRHRGAAALVAVAFSFPSCRPSDPGPARPPGFSQLQLATPPQRKPRQFTGIVLD